MGQQQLLLLVLGIVIVGLAVVVGIQAFSENQKKANADSIVNDGIRIASDIQAWSLKPAAFGGPSKVPGSVEEIGDAEFVDIGLTATSDGYTNTNGNYTLSDNDGNACIIITGVSATAGNTVTIKVDGTSQNDIETNINGTALEC